MAHVKTHVVARRNARGGRSAAEHLVAALRCLYRHAEDDGLITDADNPARKVAKPRRLPSIRRGRSGHPAGGDQRGRCHDWQRPRPRHGPAAAAHRDRLSPRRRPGPAPAGPRPGPVPDLAAGEGGDGALAAGLAHSRAALPAPGPASGRPGRRARAVPAGAMALIWLADSSRHWVHQRPYSPLLILSSSRDAGSTTPTDRYRGLPLVRCPAEPPGVATSGTAHSSADALVSRLPQISAIITRSRHIARTAAIPPHRCCDLAIIFFRCQPDVSDDDLSGHDSTTRCR